MGNWNCCCDEQSEQNEYVIKKLTVVRNEMMFRPVRVIGTLTIEMRCELILFGHLHVIKGAKVIIKEGGELTLKGGMLNNGLIDNQGSLIFG